MSGKIIRSGNAAISVAAITLGVALCISGCRDQAQPGDTSRTFGHTTTSMNTGEKDLTLLHGDPLRQTDSLPDRIRRLEQEIARGAAVYTVEELDLLERKLAESRAQLRVIEHP